MPVTDPDVPLEVILDVDMGILQAAEMGTLPPKSSSVGLGTGGKLTVLRLDGEPPFRLGLPESVLSGICDVIARGPDRDGRLNSFPRGPTDAKSLVLGKLLKGIPAMISDDGSVEFTEGKEVPFVSKSSPRVPVGLGFKGHRRTAAAKDSTAPLFTSTGGATGALPSHPKFNSTLLLKRSLSV